MEMKKNNLFLYGLVSLFVFTLSIGQTKASNYENYSPLLQNPLQLTSPARKYPPRQ